MIKLRFNKPLQQYQLPLVLRFGDDDTEPEPDYPKPRQPSIGIALDVIWLKPQQREQYLVLVDKSNRVGLQVQLSRNALPKIDNVITADWKSSPAAFESNTELQRHSIELKTASFQLEWALIGRSHIELDNVWQTTDLHNIDTKLKWKPNSQVFEHQNRVDWIETPRYQTLVATRFNSFELRAHDHTITWGPHQPDWICSTRYRPPEQGETVVIRFSEPFNQSENPVKLRLTPSPKYCYYDDGGGLIDANPSLPPIDFKLPIAPQLRRVYMTQPTIECVRIADDVTDCDQPCANQR